MQQNVPVSDNELSTSHANINIAEVLKDLDLGNIDFDVNDFDVSF